MEFNKKTNSSSSSSINNNNNRNGVTISRRVKPYPTSVFRKKNSLRSLQENQQTTPFKYASENVKGLTKSAPNRLCNRSLKDLSNFNNVRGITFSAEKKKPVNRGLFSTTLGSQKSSLDVDPNDPYGLFTNENHSRTKCSENLENSSKSKEIHFPDSPASSSKCKDDLSDAIKLSENSSFVENRKFSPNSNTKINSKPEFNLFSQKKNDENDTSFFAKVTPPKNIDNLETGFKKGTNDFVYTNKRKSATHFSNSRLVNDISPSKVRKAYFEPATPKEEKENVPFATSSEQENGQPHLIGFPNLGNTCYLNAVIQTLSALPSFVNDFLYAASQMEGSESSVIRVLNDVLVTKSVGQLFEARKALRKMRDNIGVLDLSFSLCKMQDANEFLTRLLDCIKDEFDSHYVKASANDTSDYDSSHSNSNNESLDENTFKLFLEDTVPNNPGSPASLDSAIEKDIGKVNPVKSNFEFQLLETYQCLGCEETEEKVQDYFSLYMNLPSLDSNVVENSIQNALQNYMKADERELKCEKCGHDKSSVVTSFNSLPRILTVQLKRYEYKPEIFESIKVSSNVFISKWLGVDDYLSKSIENPLPCPPLKRDIKAKVSALRNLSSDLNVCDGKTNSFSSPIKAAASPVVSSTSPLNTVTPVKTIIPAAMPLPWKADKPTTTVFNNENEPITVEDKEDEDIKQALQQSLADQGMVPDETDDEEFQKAIKMSLQESGLCFQQCEDPIVNEDDDVKDVADVPIVENVNSYRLVSIISHFGRTTTTGHYVTDNHIMEEKNWYHYDDDNVSPISESVVLGNERQQSGYIFFYVHRSVFESEQKPS